MGTQQKVKIRDSALTKKKIFSAAAQLFSKNTYDQVRITDIAKEASIDAALVTRYFKSKENLFREIVKSKYSEETRDFFEHWPEKNVEEYLALASITKDNNIYKGPDLTELFIRSFTNEKVQKIVYDEIHLPFSASLAEKIGGEDAELKATLIMAYMFGLAVSKITNEELIFNPKNKDKVLQILNAAILKCL